MAQLDAMTGWCGYCGARITRKSEAEPWRDEQGSEVCTSREPHDPGFIGYFYPMDPKPNPGVGGAR